MIDRQEKLWLIRQQIAKAISEIDHGDCPQSCLALANALGAMLSLLEAVNATQEMLSAKQDAFSAMIAGLGAKLEQINTTQEALKMKLEQIYPVSERVKELLPPDVLQAVDDLRRAEQTKIKRR